MIINHYADSADHTHECDSSEDMRAAFEEFNDSDIEQKELFRIVSMDVKALYPSMRWSEILKAVREMIENSDMVLESTNWHEVGKYLAVMMSKEEVREEGLYHVVPKRESNRGITINYLQNKKNDVNWLKARKPGRNQQKKMISLALSIGVQQVLGNHTYKVGDIAYLQTQGGPIGLELTGAVSRPFMMSWDKKYLRMVKEAGIKMPLYKRYVDDSNQVGKVPPEGAKYSPELKRILISEEEARLRRGEMMDSRLARVLNEIANDVKPGIELVEDHPSAHENNMMAILDMNVWMSPSGVIDYRHYEKEVSNKNVMHADSAHSATCKKSVHVQEILRRVFNTSNRLDWDEEVAPVLTDYMGRMYLAGYGEGYRRNVLQHAFRILEIKEQEVRDGIRPRYRKKEWEAERRRNEKKMRKQNWSTKGGHIAPIMVPSTPRGELADMLRRVVQTEAASNKDLSFKIVESGGRTVKSLLQKSNPTATVGCTAEDCIACKGDRGTGGNCRKSNVTYEIECGMCEGEDKSVYVGETSRNLYTRGVEHSKKYEGGKQDSFLQKHQVEKHNGRPAMFKAKVTGNFKDCLSRQVAEGVEIRRCTANLMNTKSEWHQPPIWRIQSEILRG